MPNNTSFLGIKKSCALLATASTAILLVACGGTGQDKGSPADFEQTYSGVAIDPYLARATVFVDSNNNGTRDAWEAWAFTDNDGYYSYNKRTMVDYCAADATAQQQQYCLISNIEYTNVVVRIDSGYDVATGEPFLGQMSRRVNAQIQDEITNSVISPITSLLSDIESTDRSALLSSLNIAEDDLNVDYLNTDGNNGIHTPLLNTALKIHKVVSVLSDRLTDTYTEIGEDFGTPNDATSSLYPNLAQQIIDAGTSLDLALSDSSTILGTLDATEQILRNVYARRELTLPDDMGSLESPQNFTRVVEITRQIPEVVDNLINVTQIDFDLNDVTSSTRALETLIIKAVNESTTDTSIDNAISFFNPQTDNARTLLDALLTNLSFDNADISTLASSTFSGTEFESEEGIMTVSSYAEDAVPFSIIANKSLKISDTINTDPNDLEDSELEIYFSGKTGDIDGHFSACIKYIDGATTTSLGDANTRGELIDGFWSLLGATQNDTESYSLLLTITFLGSTYQGILKPAGTTTVDNVEQQKIRFDTDGEISTWLSEAGLTDNDSIPTTNQQCKDRLPSRVGL